MSWNGHTVIDMDAHIRERADKFFKDYIDPEYREPCNRLFEAIARQEQKGEPYALFGSRTAVIEQIEAGRALGVRVTFGLSARSEMEHGRIAFPPGRKDPLRPIRQEVNRDVEARLEDMDQASVDVRQRDEKSLDALVGDEGPAADLAQIEFLHPAPE